MIKLVGILTLVFGYFSAISSYHEIGLVDDIENQKVIISTQLEQEAGQATTEEELSKAAYNAHMFEISSNFFELPNWFKTWNSIIATVSLLTALACSFVGLALILKTTTNIAPSVVYIVFWTLIVWGAFKMLLFYFSDTAFLTAQLPTLFKDSIVNIVLLTLFAWGMNEDTLKKV